MTDHTTETALDFDGCNRECGKAGTHTLRWGGCEHAPKPEPTVSMSKVYTDPEDGRPSIGYDSYTVPQLGDLIEPALRRVHARIGPNALAMLHRGETVSLSGGEYADLAREAAHAIVHRNDPAAPAAVPPAGGAALRGRIAGTSCVCGESKTPNVRHRPDGPCYVIDDRLRIAALAIARTEAWKWADGEPLEGKPEWQTYLAYADAVLAALPAPAADHRLALSVALGLGTGAPWDAIHDRATELAGQPAGADRAAMLREAANALAAVGPEDSRVSGPKAWTDAIETLRRMADEAQQGEASPRATPSGQAVRGNTEADRP